MHTQGKMGISGEDCCTYGNKELHYIEHLELNFTYGKIHSDMY